VVYWRRVERTGKRKRETETWQSDQEIERKDQKTERREEERKWSEEVEGSDSGWRRKRGTREVKRKRGKEMLMKYR